MTPDEHYREAERYIAMAHSKIAMGAFRADAEYLLNWAMVHATLANANKPLSERGRRRTPAPAEKPV
jgi:hypothetical protein